MEPQFTSHLFSEGIFLRLSFIIIDHAKKASSHFFRILANLSRRTYRYTTLSRNRFKTQRLGLSASVKRRIQIGILFFRRASGFESSVPLPSGSIRCCSTFIDSTRRLMLRDCSNSSSSSGAVCRLLSARRWVTWSRHCVTWPRHVIVSRDRDRWRKQSELITDRAYLRSGFLLM